MESEVLIMTQQNEEHFEVIEKNKIERYERQKLTNNVNPYSEEDFEIDLTPDEKEITHEQ
jgi:hypothetical protein